MDDSRMMALQRASDQPPSGPPVASGMEEGGPPMEDPSFILESMASALEQIAQAMPESAQQLNTAIEILRSVSASKPPQSEGMGDNLESEAPQF